MNFTKFEAPQSVMKCLFYTGIQIAEELAAPEKNSIYETQRLSFSKNQRDFYGDHEVFKMMGAHTLIQLESCLPVTLRLIFLFSNLPLG